MDNTIAYLKEIEPELRWHDEELLVFLYSFQIEDFMKAIEKDDGAGIFDDGGIQATLRSGYMVVDVAEFFSYFGEDPEQLLPRTPPHE